MLVDLIKFDLITPSVRIDFLSQTLQVSLVICFIIPYQIPQLKSLFLTIKLLFFDQMWICELADKKTVNYEGHL